MIDILRDISAAACLIIGSTFCMLSGLGMARMPDLFCRLQASTKAGTLGVPLLVIAAMIHFGTMQAVVRGSLVIAFVFLTAPISAHFVARASHRVGVALSSRTTMDALRDDEDAAKQQA